MKRVFLAIFSAFVALALTGCASSGQGLASKTEHWHTIRKLAFDVSAPNATLNKEIWQAYKNAVAGMRHGGNYRSEVNQRLKAYSQDYCLADVNLRIEFLRSAVLSYENGATTKTDKFKKYENNLNSLYEPDPYFSKDNDVRFLSDELAFYSEQLNGFRPDKDDRLRLEYVWRYWDDEKTIREVMETVYSKQSAEYHLALAKQSLKRLNALFAKEYNWDGK